MTERKALSNVQQATIKDYLKLGDPNLEMSVHAFAMALIFCKRR